ncbi:unnamed protein product [Prunus armeniaca]
MILSDIPLKESCWQCCLSILKKEGRYQQVKEFGLLLVGELEENQITNGMAWLPTWLWRMKHGNPSSRCGPSTHTL